MRSATSWRIPTSPPTSTCRGREAGGFVLGSGTPGHGHVLVPLADEVSRDQHERLEEGLRDRLGADSKIRASDLLRVPGTFNFQATLNGGGRRDVQLMGSGCYPAVRVRSHVLAGELGVDLSNIACTNGSPEPAPEPVTA